MRLNRSGHVEAAQAALERAEAFADEGESEQAQTQAMIAAGHALVAEWVPERAAMRLGEHTIETRTTISREGDGR